MAWSKPGSAIPGLRIFRFGGEGEVRLAGGVGKVRGGERDDKAALAEPQGQLHGIRQTGSAGILNLEAVDDQLQSLLFSRGRAEIDPLALSTGAEEPLLF